MRRKLSVTTQRGAASMVATAQKFGYTGILVMPVAAEVA